MTSSLQQLPITVIELILDHITLKRQLLQLRLVCYKLYLASTRKLFRRINLCSDYCIHLLHDLSSNLPQPYRLLQIGNFVKVISIQWYIPCYDPRPFIPHQAFIKLVQSCPNVEAIEAPPRVFKKYILIALLYMDDNIKWKLKKLPEDSFTMDLITIDHYYKYKDSITELNAPLGVHDLRFLKSFKRLQRLNLRKISVTTLEDYMSIFDHCPGLSRLFAGISVPASELVPVIESPHRSMKDMSLHVTSDTLSDAVVAYTTQKLVNLSNIRISMGNPHSQAISHRSYDRLFDLLIKHADRQSQFTLALNEYQLEDDPDAEGIVPFMVRVYLESLFKLRMPNLSHNLEIIQQSFINENPALKTIFRRIDGFIKCFTRLYAPYHNPNMRLGEYLERSVPYIHRLYAKSGNTSKHRIPDALCSLIKKCHYLQSLEFANYELPGLPECTNTSIQTIRLNSVVASNGLFENLVYNFPNLKHLYINDVFAAGSPDNSEIIVIDWPSICLETLDIYNLRPLHGNDEDKEGMFIITTSKKRSYFETDVIVPIHYIYDEMIIEEKLQDVGFQVYINCQSIQRFRLQNVEFKLDAE